MYERVWPAVCVTVQFSLYVISVFHREPTGLSGRGLLSDTVTAASRSRDVSSVAAPTKGNGGARGRRERPIVILDRGLVIISSLSNSRNVLGKRCRRGETFVGYSKGKDG